MVYTQTLMTHPDILVLITQQHVLTPTSCKWNEQWWTVVLYSIDVHVYIGYKVPVQGAAAPLARWARMAVMVVATVGDVGCHPTEHYRIFRNTSYRRSTLWRPLKPPSSPRCSQWHVGPTTNDPHVSDYDKCGSAPKGRLISPTTSPKNRLVTLLTRDLTIKSNKKNSKSSQLWRVCPSLLPNSTLKTYHIGATDPSLDEFLGQPLCRCFEC